MRLFLVSILILYGQSQFAQTRLDTTISKRTLDSLQSKLAEYKDREMKGYLKDIVENYTATIDTTYSARHDTLFISNYSKEKISLRRQIFTLDESGQKESLTDFYFNSSGKLLYEEQWKFRFFSELRITGSMPSRTRYHYDSLGKECAMTVESWNGGGHRVIKFNYLIDSVGKKIWGAKLILDKNYFWD